MKNTHCGYVAIIGRPNVGKSTLINHLIGEKISIISPKPQTTRWQILGINTFNDAQIIYIDTPGIHNEEKRAMNRYLNRVASAVIPDADVILFVIEATGWREEDDLVVSKLKNIKKPVVLVINKIDLLKDKASLLPYIEKIKTKFDFSHIVPISALKSEHTAGLVNEIIKLLPENPFLFPEDQLTDKSIRFITAEIIREKLIRYTEEELPYTTTVSIEDFEESEKITKVSAIIWVEREGQRVIVIGKKGEKLKKIGTQARHEIEKLIGNKVFLQLWVKIRDHWTDDENALKMLGYE